MLLKIVGQISIPIVLILLTNQIPTHNFIPQRKLMVQESDEKFSLFANANRELTPFLSRLKLVAVLFITTSTREPIYLPSVMSFFWDNTSE